MIKHHSWLAAALALGALACGSSQGDVAPAAPALTTTDNTPVETAPPPVEAVGHPSTDLIPRTTFFGNPDKASPEISPDGKHLSWLAESGGVLNVWVAPVGDLSKARAVTADKTRPVRSYFWAYTNQHIIYMQDTGGDEDYHVFLVDLASNKTTDLTPKKKVRAMVAGVSHKHPHHIVVGLNDRNPQLHDLYKVDLRSGEMALIEENPGFVGYTLDDDYNVLLAQTMDPDGGMSLYKKAPAKKAAKKKAPAKKADAKKAPADAAAAADRFPGWAVWQKIPQEDSLTTGAIGFGPKGRNIYMWDSRGRNTSALTQVDLKTGKSKVLAAHDKADGSGIHIHPTKKTVLAVSFTHARQQWKILDKSMTRDYEAMAKLADGEANVVSATHDLSTWIVAFVDDDGPVRWFKYDRKTKKGSFLFSNRKALEGLTLAKMHPRVIKSRDGLELVNYLSLPPSSDPEADGKPAQPLPMVLLVHGGPWARDNWGYDSLHQLLTNRGYAVLAVNYRGSTGLGKAFTNAGNGEWAGKMHDDLIDSVNWAVAEGVAQKDKICIAGGSYGGYATLVGLTMTPDVFACGVDIVGPSSIITLLESIPPYWKPMQDIFKTRVGDWTTPEGKKDLLERSPLSHVSKIKKPLLIGQGANDPRVKQAESDQIVAAMKTNDIPVSYVLFPDEGHGFHRPANKLAFWAAMEAFLSAHIGGHYQPATADEFKGTTMKVPTGAHGIPGFPGLLSSLK